MKTTAVRPANCLLYLSRRANPGVLQDETSEASFTDFVSEVEPRLRRALTAAWGSERGREAAAEALVYGWEHWDRVREMDNPAGYLYRVGRDRARRMKTRRVVLAAAPDHEDIWVEPALPAELARLPEQQRVVIALVHGYGWSLAETAEFLGVSKSTVQSYSDRALRKLRKRLGVEL